MKDSQKRWQPNSPGSVIATMMGFDEPRSSQSYKNQRLLSESYTHKDASVALRPGSLVPVRHSSSTKNEIAGSSKGKNANALDECVNWSSSKVRTRVRRLKPAGDRKLFGKEGEHSTVRHARRCLQKLEHDSLAGRPGIDSMSNSLNFPSLLIDKPRFFSTSISGLKPKSQKVSHDHVKLDVNNRTGYRENGKFLILETGKPHHEVTDKEVMVGRTLSLRRSCASCTRSMKRISSVEKHRSKFEDFLKAGYKFYSHGSHLLPDQSSSPSKSSNQKIERWKKAKEVKKIQVSRGNQTLEEILASTDKKSRARNLDCLGGSGLCSPSSQQSRSTDCSSPSVYSRVNDVGDDCLKGLLVSEDDATKETFSDCWNLKQDESTARCNKSKVQKTSQKDVLESESGRSREQPQTSHDLVDSMSPISIVFESSSCDFSCYGSSNNNAETYIQSIRDQIENYFEYDSCKEIERSQRNSESSISREASFNEFFEGETAFSNSGISPLESLENLKRTNQHSPDSVLESYDTKNLPSFESFDSTGLRLQLEALNVDSEETHSEGSMMGVSGEENSEEQFGDLSHGDRNLKRWPRDEDSRNYSYMVDVLDEAGFYYTNSVMDFNTWASLECPISPTAFNTLERKYGKQTSWDYAERRLLFDRINSGLLRIFSPFINIHAGATSMRRKFRSYSRRDEVEEELWMMLISEEDEKSKDLSEKALEQWFEREEGISIICGELEASLFDELVMELAHF